MSILNGCQEGKATPKLVEVYCPKCRNIMEVFVNMGANLTGRTRFAEKCDQCGKEILEGTLLTELESV